MGYIGHHVMIVVGWEDKRIEPAHAKAKELGMTVSDVIESPVNGYMSFYVAPDGSKEGWADSEEGDQQRAAFVTWLREHPALYLRWAEIHLDVDSNHVRVLQNNIADRDPEV